MVGGVSDVLNLQSPSRAGYYFPDSVSAVLDTPPSLFTLDLGTTIV